MRRIVRKRIGPNVYRGRARKRTVHRQKYAATARTPYGDRINFRRIK